MCKRCKSDTLVGDVCLNGIMSIDGMCRIRNVREPHVPANHVLDTSTAATLQGVVMTAKHEQASATASVQSKVAEQASNLLRDIDVEQERRSNVHLVSVFEDEPQWLDTNPEGSKLSEAELATLLN